MKKLFLLSTLAIWAQCAMGAVGDTTWVQANSTYLTYYGSFDTTVDFPSGSTSYRRIYMIFTLGKYSCPGYTYGTGAVPWCGDWDYTVQNYLMTPGGDTLELSRLITPYANSLAPRTPLSWTQRYIFDVTDYASKLRGSATSRIFYSGYSGGFTANIKFAFIEGTPDRNVVAIKRLWRGSYAYGDTTRGGANNINVHFGSRTETVPTGTASSVLKFTVTGHGADPNYCSEFCPRNYKVKVNGSTVATRLIWRDNCGTNQLYPQSGTYLYDRGNWCPGALVHPHYTELAAATAGATFNTNLEFDDYASTGAASYTTEATMIYYGALNKALDATLEDIVAPTNDENHFRQNPVCGSPVVRIKNTGSSTITALTISYGVATGTMNTYNWSGSLASLAETDITLPSSGDIKDIAGTTSTYQFIAKITQVNGSVDADTSNNLQSSTFAAAPKWPTTFRILMTTNNERVATGSPISQTAWVIFDMDNNIVKQRTNANISTYYNDTVNLSPGCYKLVIYDSGCNGLYWWANPSGTTGGSFFCRKMDNSNLPMRGYSYTGSYAHDFGCNYTQYFATNWPANVNELTTSQETMTAYPTPADGILNLDLDGFQSIDGDLQLTDITGRIVWQQRCVDKHTEIKTNAFPNGLYLVKFMERHQPAKTFTAKVLVGR
jgi:hypothetical protein